MEPLKGVLLYKPDCKGPPGRLDVCCRPACPKTGSIVVRPSVTCRCCLLQLAAPHLPQSW